MDDLLNEFLTEASENISVVDAELVKFEQHPTDAEILKNIFRLVHTIKGTSGFLGLPRLESLAHASEDVLGKFRDGDLKVTPNAVTLILKAIDAIKGLLAGLEDGGSEPAGDDTALIAELQALAAGDDGRAAETAPEVPEAKPAPVRAAVPAPAVGKGEGGAAKSEARRPRGSSPAARSIRVNVDHLETLMTLVSELVPTRNRLLKMAQGDRDGRFDAPLGHLSRITTDLQEGVMKTRMQPIGNAWAKLPRIIRDLSLKQGKKIAFTMQGADTELDRRILESIKDPMIHMVRNSVDHGVETPDERRRAGKPETGVVTVNAYHEGGHIMIEIVDDGRGLDMDRIRTKIVENGLATDDGLAGMSDGQIQQYIFKAGFSTAATVTGISGRGVGMDVARTNVEKLGGTIEPKSVEGKGATFTIKIPVTLAVIPALVVECGGRRFAIPQISIRELVRASAQAGNAIETTNDGPVLCQGDRLLPLVSLYDLLKLDENKAAPADEMFIVVAEVGTHTFGIMVERVFDSEEMVVRPVTPILKDIPFYSGNATLVDGSTIMILDPNSIASAMAEASGSKGTDADARARGHGGQKTGLVVFRTGGNELKAVPLDLVMRLEEIDLSAVERTQGQQLFQYRGQLIPLIPFDQSGEWKAEGRQQTIVLAEGERSIGLAVDEIVDTIEETVKIELTSDAPGLIGSALIDGHAMDVIDAGYYLTQGFADRCATKEVRGDNKVAPRRVLLVDDSLFFRNLLRPVLSVAGFEVTTAETADEALGLREAGQSFDAIVSDVEMPGMNGFEFAKAVRGDSRWQRVPMVALLSQASEKDIERGILAGFGGCVAKFDRRALVSTLTRTMESNVRQAARPAD